MASSSSQHVSNEEFLAKLTPLLDSSKSSHSIFVNHKRVTNGDASLSSAASGHYPIIVRATDGKGKANSGRTKFSTQVNPSDLATFQERYTAILRSSFAGFLKKRDKAKERRVDKLLKEKRKRMEEADKVKVTSIGSTRGAGRRKRAQAKSKAIKQRQERKRVSKAAKASASTATAAMASS